MVHRLPTQLKILKGTAQKCRMNFEEPLNKIPLSGNPQCPMGKDELKLWRDVLKTSAPGVLMESDRYHAEIFCLLHAKFRRREPMSPSDMTSLLRSLDALGLNPVARSRIHVEQKYRQQSDNQDDDPVKQFL